MAWSSKIGEGSKRSVDDEMWRLSLSSDSVKVEEEIENEEEEVVEFEEESIDPQEEAKVDEVEEGEALDALKVAKSKSGATIIDVDVDE